MWLRVVISPQNIRKIQLSELPSSVDDLKARLKSKLQIPGEFLLQYEDPEFGNELCNLTDISELPAERAVLKIVWDKDSSVPNDSDSQSVSSLDTASVSTSSQGSSHIVQSYMRSTSQWPSPFPIPNFSYDVELRLHRGNDAYAQTNKSLSVPREMKSHILEKLAEAIFSFKAYPLPVEIESVASGLILKHPCLTEPGMGKGYDGWKMSIKFKLGNYRSKLRSAGCSEVSINRKRDGGDEDSWRNNLKRAKRGEVNYLPDHPKAQSDVTLEEERLILVEELKKKNRNEVLISQKMNQTFSLRRKEIVEVVPMVSEMLERWPALSFPKEICNEFKRITNIDLLETFKASLHQHTPQLLKLYRGRKGVFGEKMEEILNRLDQQTLNIAAHRMQTALEGLPVFLREDSAALFRTCLDSTPEDIQTRGMNVGVLIVNEDDDSPTTWPSVIRFAVVLEEQVVLQGAPDLQSAVAYLFGLLFALDFQYPKNLKYTFEIIEKVFMEMGTHCSARVQSLKTKLLL